MHSTTKSFARKICHNKGLKLAIYLTIALIILFSFQLQQFLYLFLEKQLK
jgi:hypothetical protein